MALLLSPMPLSVSASPLEVAPEAAAAAAAAAATSLQANSVAKLSNLNLLAPDLASILAAAVAAPWNMFRKRGSRPEEGPCKDNGGTGPSSCKFVLTN